MPEHLKTGNGRSTVVLVARWTGRLTAAVLGAFLLMFMIGEGPPPWYVLVPCLMVLAGFGLGWKYEGIGAVLILSAFIYFNAQEYCHNGRLLRFGAFHALLVPGLAFLFC